MRLLYTLFIFLYETAIRIASVFNPKAKRWIEGRKDLSARLSALCSSEHTAWFHCASLGEFEQGRPLIEKYRQRHPSARIILTFFSPSGYEIRKNYSGADHILYLPSDTPSNARKVLDAFNPSIAFFIKYEFWFNYLTELKRRNVPTYLASGIFRKEQHFFKSYGGWFREQLRAFSGFFVQDEYSEELLKGIGYSNVKVTGDTRFDRVIEIAEARKELPLIALFSRNSETLIAGSTWEEDEKLLSGYKYPAGFRIILAPHEVSMERIADIAARFSGRRVLKYSEANEHNIATADMLLIDNIGMLSSLYQYGSFSFIGGGFGKGIHNILEAATFGMPVMFGPNYQKFREAKELIRLGGAFSVQDLQELEKTMTMLRDKQVLQMAGMISRNYVRSRAGATERILTAISEQGSIGRQNIHS